MMDTLKFGLIGCGRIASKHAQILSSLQGAKLSCVCDIKQDRAAKFAKEYNIPYYMDYQQMLKEEDVDVVNILTPSGLHARHAIDVARQKKHVVVEKPMALTLMDADEMIRVCADNKVKLFVVKQNRYNLAIKKLKEAVDNGRFGKFVMGTVRVRWCRTQDYYDQDDWRGSWAYDGGVFANQASHHIDMLLWMMGEVESVFAKTSTRLVNIEAEDTGVALLKFKNGALGIIEATTATRPKDIEGSISILGENGIVEIGSFAMNEMKIWNFKDTLSEDKDVFMKYKQNPLNIYGFGHVEFLKGVVDSLKHNNRAPIDGVEGRKTLELVNAIYKSSETGKEVFLGSEPLNSRLGTAST
jgi:UDP-N-acetyl-2-amino-2-deoxyglucuronate dehydrogenase